MSIRAKWGGESVSARARRRWRIGAAVLIAAGLVAGCTTVPGTPEAAGPEGSSSLSGEDSGAAGALDGEVGLGDDPTTRQLIAAALEAGAIDEPTSWLYRTWAEFGDSSLPEQFDGAPDGHDTELLTSMPVGLDELPADIRDQVEPYFLRPTNPASAFSDGDGPPGFRSAGSAPFISKGAAQKCSAGWTTEPVAGTSFRMWACKNLGSDAVDEGLALISGVVHTYAGGMIADMGELILDDPSKNAHEKSDELIDIYLLPEGWAGPDREGLSAAPNYGRTIGNPPHVGPGSSAYVMVSAVSTRDTARFERILVHELFHVLQYTHNAFLASRWFYDASAEWAASYYVRHDSARLHQARLPLMQKATRKSLQYESGMHRYGAYLWPLFMEQEVGPESVFAAWQELGQVPAAGGQDYVIAALDTQLEVADNFPEFVMRMYNAKLPGDPIQPRFVDLDSHFPDDTSPQARTKTLVDEPLEVQYRYLSGLASSFTTVKVPLEDPGDDYGVLVTVTGDVQTKDGVSPSLEALVQGEDDDYQRQVISYQGDGQEVCVKDELVLVLANQSTDQGDAASGSIYLEHVTDENGHDARCAKVEVSHPDTLKRLADQGEIIKVDGIERDDKPGIAPLVITVLGVEPDDVDKYQVHVTLSGKTLKGPRELDWSLSEFAPVVDGGDKYRKRATVPLDFDLTDDNRPLTIDARLFRKGDEVNTHAPTVELHGKDPCDIDTKAALDSDTAWQLLRDQTGCTGDINVRYDADFDVARDGGSGLARRGEAHFTGALTMTLGPLVRPGDPGISPHYQPEVAYYPAVEAHWRASGAYTYEVCVMVFNPGCQGNDITTQRFTADVDVVNGDNGFLVVEMTDDGPVLQASVPIEYETHKSLAGLPGLGDGDSDEAGSEAMGLNCPAGDSSTPGPSDFDWRVMGLEGMVTGAMPGISGAWADDHTKLTFDCSAAQQQVLPISIAPGNPYDAEIAIDGSLDFSG